ncbi:MAG: tRNA (guanosine(37)-N1)-methyltransferase TrmD, partial [Pyrinomonadaceae bacterium]|nr:tRNA (guanosine(37)-N1)-methyltransferase TrmD [Pyrinomonadaceae bacterium]
MKIDILTIFPEFFSEVFDFGIVRRARESNLVEIKVHDLRKWAPDKHRKTDDRPFGGGEGMVMKCEPVFLAVEELLGTSQRELYPPGAKVVLLTPQGKPLKQGVVKEFAEAADQIVLICGRYEGVD